VVVSGTVALGHFGRVGLDLVAAMLAAKSLPDVISDVHGLSINGPAFDQPVRLAEYFASSGAGRGNRNPLSRWCMQQMCPASGRFATYSVQQ
jgi:hypothetical protein